MSQNIFYCKSWSTGYKEPLKPLDERAASQLHSAGESYTALIGSETAPSCFVNVMKNKGWVSVSFLDNHLREYLLYNFRLLENEKLFLSMAVHRDFNGETDQVTNGTTYVFEESGHTVIREEKFNPHFLDKSEMTADVTNNYDRFPEFGQYDSLIRTER